MILTEDQIKHIVEDYFQDKPVKKIFLFGSYARGEANENSDVDLLVELDRSQHIGLSFFGWYQDLQDVFKRKVDVVSANGLSKYIGPYIEADKKLIYDKSFG